MLAWQFHVDYYNKELDIERKRYLIKKSAEWHIKKGTVKAVEELIAATFGDRAEISEWFQYAGQPFTFKITITNLIVCDDLVKNFLKTLNTIKNVHNRLEELDIEIEIIQPIDFIPIIEAINLAQQNYSEIGYKIIGVINNKIGLQCENKIYKFNYLLCNVPLCGTKPDISNVGRSYQATIQTIAAIGNYIFNYELCGTKYEHSTVGLNIDENLSLVNGVIAYNFDYKLCGTQYCQA